MGVLLAISRAIDRTTTVIGRSVSWLILAAVLISAGNAVVRKAFDYSSNAFLEMQWYLYGAVFMLAAAYTLLRNEHIRVDVLSAVFSKRTRDWIDLVCHVVFLSPFVFLMAWLSWPFFFGALRSGEMSSNAGGLILWPAKFLVFAGFALLCAQAVSEIIKRALIVAGRIPDRTPERDLPLQAIEAGDAAAMRRRSGRDGPPA